MVIRRYRESEVRQIFDKAVEDGPVETPVPSNGLTLEEVEKLERAMVALSALVSETDGGDEAGPARRGQ